jgi:NTP pyrophosphatase (non-canonical NTP hydrolase)
MNPKTTPRIGQELKGIFTNQKILQKALEGVGLPDYNPKLASKYALGIFTEVGETLAEDKNWKTWDSHIRPVNVPAVKEEIADVWCFLINFTLAFGMDLDEILDEIIKKQRILRKRHAEKINQVMDK